MTLLSNHLHHLQHLRVTISGILQVLQELDRRGSMSQLQNVLDTHRKVVEDGFTRNSDLRYRKYAVTTLRGGVGKSTLSFNMAFELALEHKLLAADLCAQGNLTETLLDETRPDVDVISALRPRLLGPAFGEAPKDIAFRIAQYCGSFKRAKEAYAIPGSAEMFAFPSQLYQQLQLAHSQQNSTAVASLLNSLKTIVSEQADLYQTEVTLMDTSPFYSGGTHLAWCASEALIIPVRVDEHSIDSLELTLDMLTNPAKDFQMWNERAGGQSTPRVAAIVMTMVGAKSRIQSTPDRASQMFISRAIDIANKYSEVFDGDDPSDSIVITDDFMSSGRISGAQSIPISELKVGKFHTVEGRRLQVNASASRYQRELRYLTSML
ncbi:ParA family protein [Glutamicibacter mysorens]|uniref:ParA family protein n=1 Tax=Glutamicibacter mysorens TaxID=257984 RepID=UPI0020C6BB97|nr:ParA family protein [Glutamicibacter mysorens]UTM47251.1 ParA family protein [Glutamicibacter mysorens]